jgi:hypothetical protein
MDAPPPKGIDFQTFFKYLFIGIVAALALYGIYRIIKLLIDLYYKNKRELPTPENNARIAAEQIKAFEPMYMNKGNAPMDTVASGLAKDERALINLNMLGAFNAGYLGPTVSGVFAEDDAVRIAMRAGCRAFYLPVDMLESSNSPVLIVRSQSGDKISNNVGSIAATCDAISRYAPATDPVIIVLYFRKLPSANPYDPKSMKFMMDVAAGLAPLRNRHLGLTSEGDFRRQKMQDTLFLRPPGELEGKFIVLANVDTKGFREGVLPSLPKGLTPALDLDLWTHARISGEKEEKQKVVGPDAETDEYYASLPDSKLPDIIAQSKVNWMMNIPAVTAAVPVGFEKMLDKLGLSCSFVNIFAEDSKAVADKVFGKEYFQKSGFRLKPAELRYKKLAPVQLSAPNKQLDMKGGFIEIKNTM